MTESRDNDDDHGWDNDADDCVDDSGAESTVSCPHCRREILEDVPRCPYCERYISDEEHAGRSKPVWVVTTALICLVVVVRWLFTAFGASLQ